MKEQVSVDFDIAREIMQHGESEVSIVSTKEYERLKRLHENIQKEIEAIKASIPTIKHHAALDEARWKIEYLESLDK